MRANDVAGGGRCSVPMWSGGCPAGICGEKAYGDYIPGATFTDGYTGEVRRLDGKYNGYVSGLACPRHGGPEKPRPKTKEQILQGMTDAAISVLREHILPDSKLSDHEALNRLYEIFDNQETIKALKAAEENNGTY